jgi:hypothetical protein
VAAVQRHSLIPSTRTTTQDFDDDNDGVGSNDDDYDDDDNDLTVHRLRPLRFTV